MTTTPNAWVLFESNKKQYLGSGSCTNTYSLRESVAEAHMYFSENTAGQIAKRLLGEAKEERRKVALQVVPVVVTPQTQDSVDVVYNVKRKTGWSVWVELETSYSTTYKGYWKKPRWCSIDDDLAVCHLHLVPNNQKGTIWQTADTANEWAQSLERGLRREYDRAHSVKLKHLKVQARRIK